MLNSRVHVEMKGTRIISATAWTGRLRSSSGGSERVKSCSILSRADHARGHHHAHSSRIIRGWRTTTRGCAGRNEIDESQEIHYAPIMKRFSKRVTRDLWAGVHSVAGQVASLSQAVRICDGEDLREGGV